MNAKDVVKLSLDSSDMILGAYLDGMSDADILVRPVTGMNPIAWQYGHLISSERGMIEKVRPGVSPALPAGFDSAHSTDAAKQEDFSGLKTLAEYQALAKAQREASLKAIDSLNDDELDAPSGVDYAPNIGALMNMIGVHVLMHVGQFVAVRRVLGKPVSI